MKRLMVKEGKLAVIESLSLDLRIPYYHSRHLKHTTHKPFFVSSRILGAAGPIWWRRNRPAGSRTAIAGHMRFDVADIARLVARGIYEAVIL